MKNATPGIATAILSLALLAPGIANAGVYRVAICNPALEAWYADASFQRTSRHYVSEASCGSGQAGLTVRHDGRSSGTGRWGGWTVRAPRGTFISHLGVSAAGRQADGHVPQLLAAPLEGAVRSFATPDPGIGRSRWSTPASSFVARLACERRRGCGRGRGAGIRIKRIAVRLVDLVSPTIALRGSAFLAGSRRGIQTIQPFGTDVGSGVHRFLVQVNGEPVTAHTASCRTADGYALRLSPCPLRAQTTFKAITTSSPFRQGPNVVRVCSVDYALGTGAHRACAERRVRIDNLCPISTTGPGSRLRARLSRSGHRAHDRRAATVHGRLRSASGVPVAGARVCVATRVPIAGTRERVVTTPTTGPDGRFAAALPRGPNRQVRVAYWWSADHVAERYLRLRVHARPRLKLRPHHPVHNGRRVRFEVRLQDPAAPRRWVRIQARSGKRWVELSNGRTNARGAYRAHYRFHATSRRRRYAFRAVVPRQRGYPYRAGHSRVRHVTVTG
jgi:hypothetical protein